MSVLQHLKVCTNRICVRGCGRNSVAAGLTARMEQVKQVFANPGTGGGWPRVNDGSWCAGGKEGQRGRGKREQDGVILTASEEQLRQMGPDL